MSTALFRPYAVITAVVALGLLLAGCSGSSSPQTESSENVKLEVTDEAALAKVLEAHRGKVVLVDFWATWCPECMELFPHTVELHKRLADRGLVAISVSFDDPDEDRAAALGFLTKEGATFENVISQYGSGPESFERFAIPDGALPHFKLYDREGKLHKVFASGEESIETEQIDRAVEELLAET